uniref:Uncharacterized protein n=1 Tax=Candidatus Kentrum sp. DK TaxID=2126562 RepID=A0A450TMS8_9GAMM|nr:MAG: hypothetical protein BECKDK2373B_GA0170837_12313 [Candidatus Kentron sp. DK]
MNGYDHKSCSALEKPFYRPVEAAIRWCGLIEHETQILAALGDNQIPQTWQFPQWPCLQANTEKILDAIMHGDIPHGRDGNTVAADDHVARARLTVRHTDLREWMTKHYPDQKPAFLFDETERKAHAAINADSFRALQADRDAMGADLEKKKEQLTKITKERDSLRGERDSLRDIVENRQPATGEPSERSERTYLNIIGGLVEQMLSNSPQGQKQSIFENQGKIISVMLGHYGHIKGMGDSNLEKIMAAANKTLKDSRLTGE